MSDDVSSTINACDECLWRWDSYCKAKNSQITGYLPNSNRSYSCMGERIFVLSSINVFLRNVIPVVRVKLIYVESSQ